MPDLSSALSGQLNFATCLLADVITRNGLLASCGELTWKQAYCARYISVNQSSIGQSQQLDRRWVVELKFAMQQCIVFKAWSSSHCSTQLIITSSIEKNPRKPLSTLGDSSAPPKTTVFPNRCNCPIGQLVPIATNFPADRLSDGGHTISKSQEVNFNPGLDNKRDTNVPSFILVQIIFLKRKLFAKLTFS